ncbi:MAG: hypothetical protein ABI836_11315 [Gemmatimonadota bacterium]
MSVRNARGALLALSIAILSSTSLAAQHTTTTSGRVLRIVAGDSLPVPARRLILHRVGRTRQGPMDSTVSDAAGHFRFRVPTDTTEIYLISTNFSGIEYFSAPVTNSEGRGDSAVVLVVSDTSSSAPVRLAARYFVIRDALQDGSRPVLDLLVLSNGGDKTRVGLDSLTPTWSGLVPSGVVGARVGEADFSADAARLKGDSLLVYAPLAPGEKQVTLEYLLPAGIGLTVPFPSDSVATNVLAQDASARVLNPAMALMDTQSIEGESFRRWVGAPRANSMLRVTFGRAPGEVPPWLLPGMVGLVGAGLLVALGRLRSRKPPASLENLTDRIAALEARYQGRESEVSPDEWQRYLADRERLRTELARHLAAARTSP